VAFRRPEAVDRHRPRHPLQCPSWQWTNQAPLIRPAETAQLGELIKQLKAEGIGIFLISHDLHDAFDLFDRVTVMKNGELVGNDHTSDVTHDDVLGMIIVGKCPKSAIPGQVAMLEVA
jgi:D-xylose transport system ATP-binding protein